MRKILRHSELFYIDRIGIINCYGKIVLYAIIT